MESKEILYADYTVAVVSSNGVIAQVSSPLMNENTISLKEGDQLKNIWKVVTPEGTEFQFHEQYIQEGKTHLIITDPISNKQYTVQF